MKKWIKELIPYIIIIILVLVIKTWFVAPIVVNGPSMKETLQDKDVMLLDKISYKFKKIERFDIVVIYDHDSYIIKRVIGLPGEEITYRNNQLYVNGKKVKENFSHKKTEDFTMEDIDLKTIPKGQYLVLGDNRTNSYDSRLFGTVKKDQILGHARFTIFPFNRFGSKK